MKHTKGPWRVAYNGNSLLSVYSDSLKRMIAEAPINDEIGCFYQRGSQEAIDFELMAQAPAMYDQLASARAIMQKFVDKVDRGMARSTETYAEMKQWMEEE